MPVQFTGSLEISGSLTLQNNGEEIIIGTTSSTNLSASYADYSVTASYALNSEGNSNTVSILPNIVTYTEGGIYGINNSGFITQSVGDDDASFSIPVDFPLVFLNNSYGSGSVWLVSNSYITFGPSGSQYDEYHPVGPGIVPAPAIYVGALDNSIQKYYYGYASGSDVFVIGYEGSNDTGGTQGIPAIAWELQVSSSSPNNIIIVVESTGPTPVPISFPSGIWGISDGIKWIDRFQPLPWYSNYNSNTYNSIIIAPENPQEANTLAFVGPGVTIGTNGNTTYVNIDPFDDVISVGYDDYDNQAIISSVYYGLKLTTAQDNEDIIIKPTGGNLYLEGGDKTPNQPGDGKNVNIRGGNAAIDPDSPQSLDGGNVEIRGGQKTENGNPGEITIISDSGVTNKTWVFKNDGNTLFPFLTTQRGDISGGTLNTNTLKLGDGTNQAVITTPDGILPNYSSERLVINPGQGSGSGEGGDIYLWAGRGGVDGGSGGDIKIRGGYGPLTGGGGYIRIDGGDTQDGSAGYVLIRGGDSQNGAGGPVDIYGGFGNGNTQNGNVTINTYSTSGTPKQWVFGTDGTLTIPDLLQLPIRSTDPGLPVEGMIMASGSAGSSKLYYYNGTAWVDLTA